jgi:hypothetical protein
MCTVVCTSECPSDRITRISVGDNLRASSVRSATLFTIAGDASRDVSSNATASSVIALIVLLGFSAVAGRWVAERRSTTRSSIAWFAAFASIAGIVALTLARHGAPQTFRPGDAFAWTGSGWDRLSSGDLVGSSQFLLNAALFVPAGAAWTWVSGRAIRSFAGLVALAMVIESVQGIAGLGAPDITDLAANSIGAAIGVTATVLLVAGLRHTRHSTAPDHPDSRHGAIVVVGLVVFAIAALTALLVGADRHQARIRVELEQALGNTTYDDVDAVLRGDSERLEAGARFSDSEQIFSAASVRADGFNYADDRIELRWPAIYFGFRRCVYVIWQPGSVEFRNMSGSACTDFIG